MKGLLIHKCDENIEDILESGYLKSKYKVIEDNPDLFEDEEDKHDYGITGPDEVPLIFLQLIFEDKIIPEGEIHSKTLFFDPQLIEDYGHMKPSIEEFNSYDKFKVRKPKSRVWFNPDWSHGSYLTYEDYIRNKRKTIFSVDYDNYVPLELNIFAFNYAKRYYLVNKPNPGRKMDYDSKYNPIIHRNEIVIFDKEFYLEDYLLGIHLDTRTQRNKELKEDYPEYNIMGDENTKEFIEDFFKN